MTLKHTPGPWQSVSQGLTHLVSQACDEQFRFAIARVWEQDYHPDGPRAAHIEAVANARLISAAPDMLAALQELIAELDNREPPQGHIFRDTGGMILAREAIAKATGE